ncbi:hypothetical protein SPONL_2232 [uncultured Candidatus Thioglobus sp.]|nr:hypothetical protein SPONL_2232 [uncultured Candidatus Thioglobus sp.]
MKLIGFIKHSSNSIVFEPTVLYGFIQHSSLKNNTKSAS